MKIRYNNTFKNFLKEFDLPHDLNFDVKIPIGIKKILNDEIVISDLGITLKSFGGLYIGKKGECKSSIEDFENHFHVDWYLRSPTNEKAFKLGVKTILLLAARFKEEGLKGIRFTYSMQTPELGYEHASRLDLHEDGDEYYISDRLSFHTRRKGQMIDSIVALKKKSISNKFWAALIIDI
jgi:hypothetical protein